MLKGLLVLPLVLSSFMFKPCYSNLDSTIISSIKAVEITDFAQYSITSGYLSGSDGIPTKVTSTLWAFSLPEDVNSVIDHMIDIEVDYKVCNFSIFGACLSKSELYTITRTNNELTKRDDITSGVNSGYSSTGVKAVGSIIDLLTLNNSGGNVMSYDQMNEITSNYDYYFTLNERKIAYVEVIRFKYQTISGAIETPSCIGDNCVIADTSSNGFEKFSVFLSKYWAWILVIVCLGIISPYVPIVQKILMFPINLIKSLFNRVQDNRTRKY